MGITLNTILEELNEIPVNKLEELHIFINTLKTDKENSEEKRKQILSFAGAFNDMPQSEYDDFVNDTKKTRRELFHQ